jgi:hypothetical protein
VCVCLPSGANRSDARTANRKAAPVADLTLPADLHVQRFIVTTSHRLG